MIVLIKFIKKYAKQDVNNFVILIYNKIKKIKHDDVYHGKIVNCEDFRHSHKIGRASCRERVYVLV